MIKLFGYEIGRKKDDQQNNQQEPTQKTFALPQNDDGAVTIQSGAYYGTYVDLDGVVRNEIELVTRYREMAMQPELETAIDDIVNDAIVADDSGNSIEVNTDDLIDLNVAEDVKGKIRTEFENILRLLNFGNMGHDIFRRWYIDGRVFYHLVVDEKNMAAGVQELRYIDPRRIRKIREIQKVKDTQTGMEIIKTTKEYYLYNERGVIGAHSNLGTKIAVDSVVNVNSGLMDAKRAMVLSYLHKAIKPLNQLRMIEDATVIYRLARAPERRIFYIDVGNMPTIKAEQYLRDVMVKYRNKLVYDSTTGEIRDDRKHLCFDMNTKISLLDGRELSITEIAKEYASGKVNWAYSCNPDTGEVVPGIISWAGVTRKDERVLRLTLDNDETITCTLDHKFPVKGKGFIEAQNLTIGESMIPLYRDKQKVQKNGNEYERVYQNHTGQWVFTHRLVSNWKNTVGISEEFVYDGKLANDKKTIIHHMNFNRFDNTPSNLNMMNYYDHWLYHTKTQTISYPQSMIDEVLRLVKSGHDGNKTIKEINNNIDLISTWKSVNLGKSIKKLQKENMIFSRKDLVRIVNILGYTTWIDLFEEYNPKDSVIVDGVSYKNNNQAVNAVGVNKVAHALDSNLSARGSVEWKEKLSKTRLERNIPSPTTKTWKIIHPDGTVEIRENIAQFGREKGFYTGNLKAKGYGNGYKAERVINHTIKSIEFLDDRMDVGTITIDGKEKYHDYHTFALSVGIFAKNSMLEDFYLPRREGSKGTEITTLPGAMNLGELEDVKYFEKKLYRSLGVPVSRLEPQQGFSLGRSTEITRDELKFNKFIMRLRNKFSTLFDDVLRVQLVLKKVCTEEEWNQFKEKIWYDFKKDNNFAELKETELLNNRIATLQLVDPYVGRYYSAEWVKKHVLQHTEEDIQEIDGQIQNEQAQAQANAPVDPNTGQPMPIDPKTGQPMPSAPGAPGAPGASAQVDPNTGREIDPATGQPVLPSKFEVQSNELEFVQ